MGKADALTLARIGNSPPYRAEFRQLRHVPPREMSFPLLKKRQKDRHRESWTERETDRDRKKNRQREMDRQKSYRGRQTERGGEQGGRERERERERACEMLFVLSRFLTVRNNV